MKYFGYSCSRRWRPINILGRRSDVNTFVGSKKYGCVQFEHLIWSNVQNILIRILSQLKYPPENIWEYHCEGQVNLANENQDIWLFDRAEKLGFQLLVPAEFARQPGRWILNTWAPAGTVTAPPFIYLCSFHFRISIFFISFPFFFFAYFSLDNFWCPVQF